MPFSPSPPRPAAVDPAAANPSGLVEGDICLVAPAPFAGRYLREVDGYRVFEAEDGSLRYVPVGDTSVVRTLSDELSRPLLPPPPSSDLSAGPAAHVVKFGEVHLCDDESEEVGGSMPSGLRAGRASWRDIVWTCEAAFFHDGVATLAELRCPHDPHPSPAVRRLVAAHATPSDIIVRGSCLDRDAVPPRVVEQAVAPFVHGVHYSVAEAIAALRVVDFSRLVPGLRGGGAEAATAVLLELPQLEELRGVPLDDCGSVEATILLLAVAHHRSLRTLHVTAVDPVTSPAVPFHDVELEADVTFAATCTAPLLPFVDSAQLVSLGVEFRSSCTALWAPETLPLRRLTVTAAPEATIGPRALATLLAPALPTVIALELQIPALTSKDVAAIGPLAAPSLESFVFNTAPAHCDARSRHGPRSPHVAVSPPPLRALRLTSLAVPTVTGIVAHRKRAAAHAVVRSREIDELRRDFVGGGRRASTDAEDTARTGALTEEEEALCRHPRLRRLCVVQQALGPEEFAELEGLFPALEEVNPDLA